MGEAMIAAVDFDIIELRREVKHRLDISARIRSARFVAALIAVFDLEFGGGSGIQLRSGRPSLRIVEAAADGRMQR